MSRNSRGNFNSMADAGTDYVKDGERTVALAIDYKFTPELTAGILTNYAYLKYRGITIHEGEVNLFSQWVSKTKQLKGLLIFTLVGPGWTYKNNSNTPILDSKGGYQRAHSLSANIVIDYKFNLF